MPGQGTGPRSSSGAGLDDETNPNPPGSPTSEARERLDRFENFFIPLPLPPFRALIEEDVFPEIRLVSETRSNIPRMRQWSNLQMSDAGNNTEVRGRSGGRSGTDERRKMIEALEEAAREDEDEDEEDEDQGATGGADKKIINKNKGGKKDDDDDEEKLPPTFRWVHIEIK